MNYNKFNRRYFIKSAIAAITLGIVGLWSKMISTQQKISLKRKVSLLIEPNKEISFQDNYIVINKNSEITVLSSRCTHLGCKINESVNNKLLCPCHGSTFDVSGNSIKGPATKALKKLDFEIDNTTGKIIVLT